MSEVVVHYARHYADGESRYDSVRSAAAAALHMIDYGEAYPTLITSGEEVLWIHAPLDRVNTYEQLEAMAGGPSA